MKWRGIFKAIEEIGELNIELADLQVLLSEVQRGTGKISQLLGKLGPFPSGEHPDGKGHLKDRLEDELGDLLGILQYFSEHGELDLNKIDARARTKYDKFKEWGLDGIRTE